MPLPEAARTLIRGNRVARLQGADDALDGHALLCRAKVAVALTLLEGRRAVTDDDWRRSGMLMRVSDATHASVQRTLASQQAEANVARGHAEGVRSAIADETKADVAAKRVASVLLRFLRDKGAATRGKARKAVASADREHFDAAVDRLVSAGQVELHEAERVTGASA